MKALRNFVVALLLAVWLGPTAAHAAQPLVEPRLPGPPAEPAAPPAAVALSPSALLALGATPGQGTAADQQEAKALAAREQAAPILQDYRGGRAYIYIGSGATLILVVILLIILL